MQGSCATYLVELAANRAEPDQVAPAAEAEDVIEGVIDQQGHGDRPVVDDGSFVGFRIERRLRMRRKWR